MNKSKSSNNGINILRSLGYTTMREVKRYILIKIGKTSSVKRTKVFTRTEYDLVADRNIPGITNEVASFYVIENKNKKRLLYADTRLLDSHIFDQLCNSLEHFHDVHSILDVGCGEGNFLNRFSKGMLDVKLNGIDISPNRIRNAIKNNKGRNITFSVASADDLPFDDNSVDVIYTRHSLEQMPLIIDSVIKEFYRVCKQGIILVEPFFEKQNLIGRIHNASLHYVRNIPSHVINNRFDVVDHSISFGSFANQSSILIAKK